MRCLSKIYSLYMTRLTQRYTTFCLLREHSSRKPTLPDTLLFIMRVQALFGPVY
jgi:hypothetical protein